MLCPRCKRNIPDDSQLCCYCGRYILKKPGTPHRRRPNGAGYAVKRGSTWTACVCIGKRLCDDGVTRRRLATKGGFRTKGEALAYCEVLKSPGGSERTCPTLADYWQQYEQNELALLSPSKQSAYRTAWKKLALIAPRPIDSLSVQDLRSTVAEAATTFYPARDMKTILTRLFDLAGADRWVDKSLPSYILLPKLVEKERTPFSDIEQAQLWRLYESGDRRAAVPLIMIYTGMMPGEMQSLKLDMIDLDARRIVGVGMKTKVRKESPVYLPGAILPVLEAEMADPLGRDGYLLPRNEDAFYANYYAALEAAGCRRLEPYSCRHTTATALAVSENIAPQTVKKIMRWSTTKMLDRYAHPDDADAATAIDTLKTRH